MFDVTEFERLSAFNPKLYSRRRRKLARRIGEGVVIIPNAPVRIRSNDCDYTYRFDSDFYYLTGFKEPNSVLIFDATNNRSVIFCMPKDLEREIWDGFRFGLDEARKIFRFDESFAISDFGSKLTEFLSGQVKLYFPISQNMDFDRVIFEKLNDLRNSRRRGFVCPSNIFDSRTVLAEMRLIKDRREIELLRHVCALTADGYREALSLVHPGMYEFQLEGILKNAFVQRGCVQTGYNPIVASGSKACVLHYTENRRRIREGDLVLVDAGAEFEGYNSDISRTFPINGRFSGKQRAVYDVVLQANKDGIDAVSPGKSSDSAHRAVVRTLTQGLKDLNVLRGNLDSLIEQKAYSEFYMHGTSHWLGLDVHDVGDYSTKKVPRKYEKGMFLTIEPGLYFRPGSKTEFDGIGIRIEDNILVTENGVENFTSSITKEAKELEVLICS